MPVVEAVIIAVAHPRLGDAPLVVAGEVPRVGARLDRRLGAGVGVAPGIIANSL